ncbi:atherin-like [Tiliqua scincoides]|uniref:atherin-like n=1 Tax=Tiliqua scincoides TaxID=71010 RepID=UPI0034618669
MKVSTQCAAAGEKANSMLGIIRKGLGGQHSSRRTSQLATPRGCLGGGRLAPARPAGEEPGGGGPAPSPPPPGPCEGGWAGLVTLLRLRSRVAINQPRCCPGTRPPRASAAAPPPAPQARGGGLAGLALPACLPARPASQPPPAASRAADVALRPCAPSVVPVGLAGELDGRVAPRRSPPAVRAAGLERARAAPPPRSAAHKAPSPQPRQDLSVITGDPSGGSETER